MDFCKLDFRQNARNHAMNKIIVRSFDTQEGCLFEEVKSTAIKKFNFVPPLK